VASEASRVRGGFTSPESGEPLTRLGPSVLGTLSQPKSDVSDFGHS